MSLDEFLIICPGNVLEVTDHLAQRRFDLPALLLRQRCHRTPLQLTTRVLDRLLELNGEPLADDAATRPLEDPWEGIVDNSKSRVLLGVRPIYPSVYSARDAGAL
jgi:hypothetical protein